MITIIVRSSSHQIEQRSSKQQTANFVPGRLPIMPAYTPSLKRYYHDERQLRSDLERDRKDETMDQTQEEKRLTTHITFGDFCPRPAALVHPVSALLFVMPPLVRT